MLVRGGLRLVALACDLDEQALALRKHGSMRVQDSGFAPVLAAFAARDPSLDTQRSYGRNRTKEVHFHVPRHCCKATGADGFAHGFVKQGCDYSAVEQAYMALESVRHRWQADNRTVWSQKEVQTQATGIGRSTAEAAVLRLVPHGRECFFRLSHVSLLAPATSIVTPELTAPER